MKINGHDHPDLEENIFSSGKREIKEQLTNPYLQPIQGSIEAPELPCNTSSLSLAIKLVIL